VLLDAFFLYLPCCEYHVHGASSRSESTLTFWDNIIIDYVIYRLTNQP